MVFNRRPPSTRRPARAAAAVRRAAHGPIDALERRRLMAAVTSLSQLASQEQVTTPVGPILADPTTPASNSVPLSSHFTDPLIPGTVVTFATTATSSTSDGSIVVALTDQATPQTVADFLAYANAGDYTNTIFHRSVNFETGNGGSPTAPADIVQGGGYVVNNSSGMLEHIAVNNPVADEYTTATFGDLQGTLALAKTGDADSGTSEFFFNVNDNTAALDTPTAGSDGTTTSYTAFGAVLSGLSTTVDTIAGYNTADVSSTFADLPLKGVTAAQISSGSYTESDLVYTTSVTAAAGTTYTATSDDPALVTPTVTDGVLSFAYGAGKTGVADVTVTATNYDKTTASTTFAVTVPGTAATPTAVPFTAPAVTTGQSVTFDPLAGDTSTATAAFDPSTVTVTTAPAHGTATVNASSGQITYTPAAGYTGTDTLQYTVADTAAAVSNPAVVTLTTVPTAAVVTIGGTAPATLSFTQPDGTVATIRVAGGTAAVSFASYAVTVGKTATAVTATGAGATVDSVAVTDTRRFGNAALFVTSTKPISIGSITNPSSMSIIQAPTVTLTGTLDIGGGLGGGVGGVTLGGLDGATVTLAARPTGTNLFVPTVVNSAVDATGSLSRIQSTSWTVNNGGTYNVSAVSVSDLIVPGGFADGLALTGRGYDVIVATVGTPSAPWDLSGSVYHATLTNPAAAWGLSAAGVVQNLKVTGNLNSTVDVAAINQMSVTGNLASAVVQTTEAYSARGSELRSLKVGGTISNSTLFAAGNVGAISAGAITGSRLYAGVALSEAQDSALPAATSDLTGPAKIASITLPAGGSFTGSLIAAYQMGTLRLGTVGTSDGGTAFGVASAKVASLRAALSSGATLALSAPQFKTAATLAAAIAAEKVTLGDFEVQFIATSASTT